MNTRDRTALIAIAEALAAHLSDCEATEDCIRFGPAPSDHVRDAIEVLKTPDESADHAADRGNWDKYDGEHEDTYQ